MNPRESIHGKGEKPDERALLTALVSRRLAYPLALAAHRLGLSPNQVTVISGLCWMVSLPLTVLAGTLSLCGASRWLSPALWFLCGFLWDAGYILDVVDGSLARMTGRSTKAGFFLDYVFHLLFKPAFLPALGLGLIFSWTFWPLDECPPLNMFFLALIVWSGPANWSASSSSAEHVLCESYAKHSLREPADPALRNALWLGTTGIADAVATKRGSLPVFAKNLALEMFSYYGQMVFFSVTVLVDILIWLVRGAPSDFTLPVTGVCFLAISLLLVVRIPFRIAKDFRRVALADAEEEEASR